MAAAESSRGMTKVGTVGGGGAWLVAYPSNVKVSPSDGGVTNIGTLLTTGEEWGVMAGVVFTASWWGAPAAAATTLTGLGTEPT